MRRHIAMFALAAAFAVSPVSSVLAETVTTKTTTVREPTGRLVITDAQTRSFRLGSESKVMVDLACSSHNAMWEKNRKFLFDATVQWLREGRVNGRNSGIVRMGY